MEYGFVCQRCQTIYIVETTPDDAANALDDLREKGCGDCGGHAFGITDVVRDSCTGVDADCECGEHWSPAFMAQDSFLLYITQYRVWRRPTEGAVSPTLGEFFRFCNPELPALVHWARWLRIKHECDDHEPHEWPVDEAEELLEAMIATRVSDRAQARMMRLAFHEGFGERDPDQLELFDIDQQEG